MDSNDKSRPVWLTREQRNALYGDRREHAIAAVLEAWDAAPTDATEAVRDLLCTPTGLAKEEWRANPWAVEAVLRALGMPE